MRKFKTNPKDDRRTNRDAEMADSAAKDYREDSKVRNKQGNRHKFNKNQNKSTNKNNRKNGDSKYRVSTSNPFQWYDAFPQVIKDAGNLGFGVPLGKSIIDDFNVDLPSSGSKAYRSYYSSPGVLALTFVPGIGWSEDKTSPINRSATKMFVYLRSGQKAAKDYNSQDMMMMIMALDSCYAFHKLLQRIYGCMSLATPVNYYYPRTLVHAQGVDFDDIEANMSDFRAYINQFAISLGSYTLPGNIDILKRHMWMNSGIYADQNSAKAQTYMFVPSGFWKYDNTVTTGSKLTFKRWTSPDATTKLKFADIKAFGQDLLNSILGDDDAAFISGDLLAAFGTQTMATVDETPEGYRILPSYDVDVLMQIQNCTICGFLDAASLVITQDPSVNKGAIIFKPKTQEMYAPSLTGKVPINLVDLNTSYERVVEATRLVAASKTKWNKTVEQLNNSGMALELDICAADIVEGVYIATGFNNNTWSIFKRLITQDIVVKPTSTGSTIDSLLSSIAKMSAFDWAPRVNLWIASTASMRLDSFIWETDNVTYADHTQVEQLHEAAFTSLFNVPEMAFTLKK